MPRQLRVFLCHASQDKPIVRELYQRLKAENWIDPWLDKAKLLPGQDWELVIEKAVDDSDVVIVCLSSQSVSKEGFVQREIRYAYDLALEKPEDTIFLIPLRLDDCIVPRKLRTLHWVDYFDLQVQKDAAFFDLLNALKLRHEQVLHLEEKEVHQQKLKEKAQQEAEDLVRKIALEKVEREKAERAKAERVHLARVAKERIAEKKAKLQTPIPTFEKKSGTASKLNVRGLGIAGAVFTILLLAVFSGIYLIEILTPTPTNTPAPMPPTVAPTPGIGATKTSEKDRMTLVYVPAGEFTMGSDADDALAECQKYRSECKREWFTNEEPPHEVELNAYWIDQTEVTNAMYAKCVNDGRCEPPASSSSYSRDLYFGNSTYNDYPVIHINWYHAAAYCEWAGRELPTEAQWEKAARGTSGRTYSWGESISCSFTNYWGKDEGCIGDTSKVGSYPDGSSIYGALDMTGNVWEWVKDWYLSTYYQESPVLNPLGRSSGQERSVRGGAWSTREYRSRTTFRHFLSPTIDGDGLGFRCAFSQP